MSTTGRQDVVSGLLSVLTTYMTANPTLLRQVWIKRPGGFSEFPTAYIGDRDETLIHTSGLRQRNFIPTVVLVDTFSDNAQVAARMDVLVDGLIDAYTAAPLIVSGAECHMTGSNDIELREPRPDGGNLIYPACVFTFAITLMEGRV